MAKVNINDNRVRTPISRLSKTDFFLTQEGMLGMILYHDVKDRIAHCYMLTNSMFDQFTGECMVTYVPEDKIFIEVNL